MKRKRISIEINSFGVSENDNLVVFYTGKLNGKKIFEGQYEFLKTPENEDVLQSELLKEIDALVKGYGNGVKH
jgi:demethoxyubiquinone hydroxylase (CLK1/Coq7/Cat5 family)